MAPVGTRIVPTGGAPTKDALRKQDAEPSTTTVANLKSRRGSDWQTAVRAAETARPDRGFI